MRDFDLIYLKGRTFPLNENITFRGEHFCRGMVLLSMRGSVVESSGLNGRIVPFE